MFKNYIHNLIKKEYSKIINIQKCLIKCYKVIGVSVGNSNLILHGTIYFSVI